MFLRLFKPYLMFSILLVFVFSIALFPNNAIATPMLGVATNGVYYSPDGTCTGYQLYFATCADASENGGNHGFGISSSGDDLIIWSGDTVNDIWLLTTEDVYTANDPHFGGIGFTQVPGDTGMTGGYKPLSYYGINFGMVDLTGGTTGWDWADSPLPAPPFSPASMYYLTGALTYDGAIEAGQYFFAAANDDEDLTILSFNNSKEGGNDSFSPKTSSATGVPEPGTLILLGTGLIGLGLLRRKSRK